MCGGYSVGIQSFREVFKVLWRYAERCAVGVMGCFTKICSGYSEFYRGIQSFIEICKGMCGGCQVVLLRYTLSSQIFRETQRDVLVSNKLFY